MKRQTSQTEGGADGGAAGRSARPGAVGGRVPALKDAPGSDNQARIWSPLSAKRGLSFNPDFHSRQEQITSCSAPQLRPPRFALLTPADFGAPAPLQASPTTRVFQSPSPGRTPHLSRSRRKSRTPAATVPAAASTGTRQSARSAGLTGRRAPPSGEGVPGTCPSARVRARLCPRASLAVRAEPAALTPGRRRAQPMVWAPARGGSLSRQSPRRAAAPTRSSGSRSTRRGRGGGACPRARGGARSSPGARGCAGALASVRARPRAGVAGGAGCSGGAGGSGHRLGCAPSWRLRGGKGGGAEPGTT